MNNRLKPIVRPLDEAETHALLHRNRVGRIAYCLDGGIDLEPIHYVFDGSWIYGRTSPTAKLLTLPSDSPCAFEADEVEGMWDWASVVVKGRISTRHSPGATWDYDAAVAALRRLLPTALTVYDPTPKRDVVFAIHAGEISGRCSVSNGSFEGQAVASQAFEGQAGAGASR